jgi:hypothetical protein
MKEQKHKESPFNLRYLKNNVVKDFGGVPIRFKDDCLIVGEGEEMRVFNAKQSFLKDGLPYIKMSVEMAVDVIGAGKIGKSGMMVLATVLRVMLRHKEHFFLTYEMFESVVEAKVSRMMFYKGINELIEAEVIARGAATNFYWLNTNYVFKGDRVKMLKDKRWGDGMFNS